MSSTTDSTGGSERRSKRQRDKDEEKKKKEIEDIDAAKHAKVKKDPGAKKKTDETKKVQQSKKKKKKKKTNKDDDDDDKKKKKKKDDDDDDDKKKKPPKKKKKIKTEEKTSDAETSEEEEEGDEEKIKIKREDGDDQSENSDNPSLCTVVRRGKGDKSYKIDLESLTSYAFVNERGSHGHPVVIQADAVTLAEGSVHALLDRIALETVYLANRINTSGLAMTFANGTIVDPKERAAQNIRVVPLSEFPIYPTTLSTLIQMDETLRSLFGDPRMVTDSRPLTIEFPKYAIAKRKDDAKKPHKSMKEKNADTIAKARVVLKEFEMDVSN